MSFRPCHIRKHGRTFKSSDQRRTDPLPELAYSIKQPGPKPRGHLLKSHKRTSSHNPHRDLLFRLLFLYSLDCLFRLFIFQRQNTLACRLENWVDGCILAQEGKEVLDYFIGWIGAFMAW
jgi:hypothetical protein